MFCSLGVTGGVVVGQIVSLKQVFGTDELWHYALSFYVIFAVICTLPYCFFPESPKYLLLVANNRERAIKELLKLYGGDIEALNEELESMQPTSNTTSTFEKRGILSIIKDPALLLPIVLVCSLQGGQQLSGINAVKILFLLFIYNIFKKNFFGFFNRSFTIQFQFLNRSV